MKSSTRHSSANQRARWASGEDAEKFVNELAIAHELARIAVFKKRATPKVMRGGRLVHTASPGVDYVGHLRGGRALYFDVKRAQDSVFSFSHIRTAQRAELARAHEDGALAFILVVAGPVLVASTLHLVPWDAIRSAESVGITSLKLGPEGNRRVPRPLFLEGVR